MKVARLMCGEVVNDPFIANSTDECGGERILNKHLPSFEAVVTKTLQLGSVKRFLKTMLFSPYYCDQPYPCAQWLYSPVNAQYSTVELSRVGRVY